MKSTKKLCATIKERRRIARERWENRFLSLALILFAISFLTLDAIPGLVGAGIIIILLIADEKVRRRF